MRGVARRVGHLEAAAAGLDRLAADERPHVGRGHRQELANLEARRAQLAAAVPGDEAALGSLECLADFSSMAATALTPFTLLAAIIIPAAERHARMPITKGNGCRLSDFPTASATLKA